MSCEERRLLSFLMFSDNNHDGKMCVMRKLPKVSELLKKSEEDVFQLLLK
jgi:hypothetical protein